MTIAATLTAVTTAVLQIVLLYSTNEYPQTQQCMDGLCDIMETFEEDFRRAATGSQHGKNSEIAGLVMMGLGIALALLPEQEEQWILEQKEIKHADKCFPG